MPEAILAIVTVSDRATRLPGRKSPRSHIAGPRFTVLVTVGIPGAGGRAHQLVADHQQSVGRIVRPRLVGVGPVNAGRSRSACQFSVQTGHTRNQILLAGTPTQCVFHHVEIQ